MSLKFRYFRRQNLNFDVNCKRWGCISVQKLFFKLFLHFLHKIVVIIQLHSLKNKICFQMPFRYVIHFSYTSKKIFRNKSKLFFFFLLVYVFTVFWLKRCLLARICLYAKKRDFLFVFGVRRHWPNDCLVRRLSVNLLAIIKVLVVLL